MKNKTIKLPEAELEVMQQLWNLKPPVSRQLLEEKMKEVRPIAQTTLLTFITRLANKGAIKIEKVGRSSQYTPLISKEEYVAMESESFIDKICGGSISVLASGLRDSGISEEDLEELQALLKKGGL